MTRKSLVKIKINLLNIIYIYIYTSERPKQDDVENVLIILYITADGTEKLPDYFAITIHFQMIPKPY